MSDPEKPSKPEAPTERNYDAKITEPGNPGFLTAMADKLYQRMNPNAKAPRTVAVQHTGDALAAVAGGAAAATKTIGADVDWGTYIK